MNFTAVKKDQKFPWWSNASDHLMNFSATNKVSAANKGQKDQKFPWWSNASESLLNFTALKKALPNSLPKGIPSFADLGPFGSKVEACNYCFTSHTRSEVVQNCICTAYDGSDGPTMFCTGTQSGLSWVQSKSGGCRCVENN